MRTVGKAPTSAGIRVALLELARKAMEKCKAVGADTIDKRVNLSAWREPLVKTPLVKGECASQDG